MKKRTKGIVGIMFVFLICLNLVSADFFVCFDRRDRIDFCNPSIRDRVAPSDEYQICMAEYDSTNNCYESGSWNVCNALSGDCLDDDLISNGNVDPNEDEGNNGNGDNGDDNSNENDDGENNNVTPTNPDLAILSVNIENDEVFDDDRINVEIELNEDAEIYYSDDDGDRWRRLCSRNCESYSRSLSFDDGENEIIFKAENDGGEDTYEVEFIVDSRDPRIRRTYPSRGFADGTFSIEFDEANPETLILFYGDDDKEVDLDDCTETRRGHSCSVYVALDDYNGGEIEYYFELTDIAGNVEESRTTEVDVDTVFPVVNSFDYEIDGRRINFEIEVDDDNFDSIEYIDYADSRPRWRTMCSRLRDGVCEKRVSLRSGDREIYIQAVDEAGNAVSVASLELSV